MKRIILFIVLCICVGVTTLSCSNEHVETTEASMKGELSAEHATLKGYFSTPSFVAMVKNHKIDVANIDLANVVKNSYVEAMADSYIIPVIKEGKTLGNLIVATDYKASLYCDVYIDLATFNENASQSTFSIFFSDGSKVVDYSVAKHQDKYALRIRKVYRLDAIDGERVSETYQDCVSRVFSAAKRACEADDRCATWCAVVDIAGTIRGVPGACTASMLTAAAVSCTMRDQ